ncbi:MAG TPA: DUF4062 domain-containing protein [Verrucomicrobiae bacterium]|nr:DUF4062 domain-containing protein [Verrucomicrobiae bacterium]
MIPNIFVSSTIDDLHHLRDTVRDSLQELAYTPVMSEYGDVGYLPTVSAQDACYHSIGDCHMAVLLIGKRYGTPGAGGLSVTHNEFRSAMEKKIPFILLVDQEVLSFKRVWDASPENAKPQAFPGMDDPRLTFEFIQEIIDSPLNNGILPYSRVSDVRNHLKRQLAHIFGEALRKQTDPIKAEIKDVLSEVKALRYELVEKKAPDPRFITAVRFMIDDSNNHLLKLTEAAVGPVDKVIPLMLEGKSFEDFLQRAGVKIELVEDGEVIEAKNKELMGKEVLRYSSRWAVSHLPDPETKKVPTAGFTCLKGGNVILDKNAKTLFDATFEQFKVAVRQ